jgi:hypothetical protein
MADPSKVVHRAIVEAVRVGATYRMACKYAGVRESDLHGWMSRGAEESDGACRDLLDGMLEADSKGAVACLARIHSAAKDGNWQAAAWLLERRHGFKKDGVRGATELDAKTKAQNDRYLELVKQHQRTGG